MQELARRALTELTEMRVELAERRAYIAELEAQIEQYRSRRTLGGPVTGRRVPALPGAWDNVNLGGPVQHDYTGATVETTDWNGPLT